MTDVTHQRQIFFLLYLPEREVLGDDVCREQIGEAGRRRRLSSRASSRTSRLTFCRCSSGIAASQWMNLRSSTAASRRSWRHVEQGSTTTNSSIAATKARRPEQSCGSIADITSPPTRTRTAKRRCDQRIVGLLPVKTGQRIVAVFVHRILGSSRSPFERDIVKMRHRLERLEPLVDLGIIESIDTLGAELLDVERRHHRAVNHRTPQRSSVISSCDAR